MTIQVLHFSFLTNEPQVVFEGKTLDESREFLGRYAILEMQARGTFAIQTAPDKIEFQPHQFVLRDGTVLPSQTPAMFRIVPYPMFPRTQKAEAVKREDLEQNDMNKLISTMLYTMYGAPGVGLAAPQIGIARQIFVMDPDLATTGVASPTVILNPSLSNLEGLEPVPNEGCLSVPGIRHDTKRARSLVLSGWDLKGEEFSVYLEGWPAAIAQHEYDHLQGKIFLDTLSPLKRDLYKTKLKKANKKAERFVTQMNTYEQKKKALLQKEERRICDLKETRLQEMVREVSRPTVDRTGLSGQGTTPFSQ